MLSEQKEQKIFVGGMTCAGCEAKIEKKLKAVGASEVKADRTSGLVSVVFEGEKITLFEIKEIIAKMGYDVLDEVKAKKADKNSKYAKILQISMAFLVICGGLFVINSLGGFDFFNRFPQAEEGMGYAAIFILGLITSVHCVGMCGGINLSQCAKISGSTKPAFLYNAGRIASYTAVGGLVGALGSVVSLGGHLRGIVAIVAGVFMVLMGINMLNILPNVRFFNFRLPVFLTRCFAKLSGKGAFYVGLANGLMPCGPLQAMQLYAMSTGSVFKGAAAMFFFSAGTAPLMFGLGAASSFMSRKFTQKMMTASAVLVIILGIVMFNTGMGLSGLTLAPAGISKNSSVSAVTDGEQTVVIQLQPNAYAPITVKKGIPVKWVIEAKAQDINGCNNEIIIPAYGISKKLTAGDNVIEFTPPAAGTVPYSCWMGMIRSVINVTE